MMQQYLPHPSRHFLRMALCSLPPSDDKYICKNKRRPLHPCQRGKEVILSLYPVEHPELGQSNKGNDFRDHGDCAVRNH